VLTAETITNDDTDPDNHDSFPVSCPVVRLRARDWLGFRQRDLLLGAFALRPAMALMEYAVCGSGFVNIAKPRIQAFQTKSDAKSGAVSSRNGVVDHQKPVASGQ
jgi:hypothetical protein